MQVYLGDQQASTGPETRRTTEEEEDTGQAEAEEEEPGRGGCGRRSPSAPGTPASTREENPPGFIEQKSVPSEERETHQRPAGRRVLPEDQQKNSQRTAQEKGPPKAEGAKRCREARGNHSRENVRLQSLDRLNLLALLFDEIVNLL